jgi:hypothetical protein
VLSGNLALPIGIHLSTNVWVVSVFGQSGTGFPALVRFDRSLEIGWETVPTFLFPTVVLFALILGWVFLTQGSLTWDGIFSERTED